MNIHFPDWIKALWEKFTVAEHTAMNAVHRLHLEDDLMKCAIAAVATAAGMKDATGTEKFQAACAAVLTTFVGLELGRLQTAVQLAYAATIAQPVAPPT